MKPVPACICAAIAGMCFGLNVSYGIDPLCVALGIASTVAGAIFAAPAKGAR